MSKDPEDIRAWHRLSPRITTSGRIEEKDIARLAAIGVAHVINLAVDEHPEALADEGAKLALRGIRYTHIPVPFHAPDAAHYAAFVAALEADDAPVHVHCIANYRVSAFFCVYHQERGGMDEDGARQLMERHWVPEAINHPSARPWVEFLKRKNAP